MLVWKYIVASVVSITFFSQQVLWAADTFAPVQELNTTRPIQIYRPVSSVSSVSVSSVSNVMPIAQTYPAPESQPITTTEFLQNDTPLSASDDPSLDSDTNPNVESTGSPGIDTGNLKDLIPPDLEPIPNPIDPELRDQKLEVTGSIYYPPIEPPSNQIQYEEVVPVDSTENETESVISPDRNPIVIQINDTIIKDTTNWISFGTGFTISNYDPDVSGFAVINNQDTTYTPLGGSPVEISGQGVGFYIASGGLRFGDSVHIQTYINNNHPAGTYRGSHRVQASRTADSASLDVATVYYTIEVRDSSASTSQDGEPLGSNGAADTFPPPIVLDLDIPSAPVPDSFEPIQYGEIVPVESGIALPVINPPVPYVRESDTFSGNASGASFSSTIDVFSPAATTITPMVVSQTEGSFEVTSSTDQVSPNFAPAPNDVDAFLVAVQTIGFQSFLRGAVNFQSPNNTSSPVVFGSSNSRKAETKLDKDEKVKKGSRFQSQFYDLILKPVSKSKK